MSKIGSLSGYSILVTGASGFLGSRIVYALLKSGAFVVGVDSNNQPPEFFNELMKNSPFHFIHGSFNEKSKKALSILMSEEREKKAVFHMAGLAHAGECEKDPVKAFESNVSLTFYALEFCRRNKIKKFVFPSTGLVYGDRLKRQAVEEDPLSPQNIYTATKLSAEVLIRSYSKSYGLSCIIARLGNIYGPGSSSDTVVTTIIKQVIKGGKIIVHDLTPVRDFIYIDDVIEGLMRLLVSIVRPECYIVNLSTGIGTSVFNLAKMASSIVSVPNNEVQPQGDSEPSNSTLVLDNSLLLKITGWKPRYTLSEGLSLTLKGYDQKDDLQ